MLRQRIIAKGAQLFWGLAGLAVAVVSVASEDVEGAKDLDFIERFPQSWIVDYSQQQMPDYSLATGRIKKINGVISPQSQQYLAGKLTRITYRVPSSRSSRQVLDHFERQFDKLQPQLIYGCDGRNCGESNQWANVQLKIARLYGIDREQYYRALQLDQNNNRYLAFYTVKRGNKRVYAHLDLIETGAVGPASNTDSALVSIDQLGSQPVYRLADNVRMDDIDYLKQRLDRESSMQLVLVGHSQQGDTLIEQTQQAQTLAEDLRQRLVDSGINSERIVTQSLGGLVPLYDQPIAAERVELQLHPLGYIE